MIWVAIFAIVVVVAIPVGFLMSTSFAALVMGALLKTNAEVDANSDLLDNNY